MPEWPSGPQRLQRGQPAPPDGCRHGARARRRRSGSGRRATACPAPIQKVSYLGSSADYTVETELGPVLITDYEMQGGVLPAGTAVRLEFLPHGVYPLPAV